MSKLTTLGMREVFENAVSLLAKNGYDVKSAKLTQSELRSEVKMSASSTRFHLPVTINDQINGNAFNTEKRLNLQDVFITSAIGVYVAAPSSDTDTQYELSTYAPVNLFTGANEVQAIKGAYSNGNLSMIIDNDQILPFYPLNWHYKVPFTQAATNAFYDASDITLQDSRDGSFDGIMQIEPNFILSGNAQIDFNLNLPSAMAAAKANSRFVVVQYGLLAQNCTKVAQ